MASDKQDAKSKKRKQFPSRKGDKDTKKLKEPRLLQPKSTDGATKDNLMKKKPFKLVSGDIQKTKKNLVNSEDKQKKEAPLSAKERRLRAKEITEARKKKRKRHYNLEQELALLWEKMRRRNIAKEERSKLITQALQKMKGKIPEIAGSHVSSRVLQTCVKHCSEAERNAVFEELQPQFLTLASNTYAVHLVNKMLDNASKSQLAGFVSALRGHVAALLRHMVGSVVVENSYKLSNATQKRKLLMELYSPELQLFKDLASITENRLVEIISKLSLQKSSVLRHMTAVLQPILEKGIIDHSIIHKALVEYLSIADQSSAMNVIQQLSTGVLIRMIHTRDGSKVGILCIKHGSAKERKKIVKGMKGHIAKIAHDHHGSTVLVCVLSTVDDTKLLTKIIIRELQRALKELIMDKSGRHALLHLLHPFCPRYFSPDDLDLFSSSVPSLNSETGVALQMSECKPAESMEVDKDEAYHDEDTPADEAHESGKAYRSVHLVEGGKKDPLLRRQELLIKSGLAETLVDTCIENADELLRSNFGKEVLYEVATAGADGILRPHLDDKLTSLYQTIASLAAEPKVEDSEHLFENFHSSRTIRKLVLDCPAFASILWKVALDGQCEKWAKGYSSKVVSSFLESSNSKIRELAEEDLQPLVDSGVLKVPEPKQQERD